MSQQEFENYLALLSRLLRISPHERDRVAEEFRSHMEDRLDDLLARGMPRDEAVRQALEEFGDAAGLAAELVSLNRNRRNRWIMRLTTASAAAMVLMAAGIVTFWPGHNAGPGAASLVAQDPNKVNPDRAVDPFAPPGGAAPAAGATAPVAPVAAAPVALADKLNERTDAEFVETPLKDAMQFLAEKSQLQIIIKQKRLEEAGINSDTPITLSLKNVRLSTLFDVMLEDLGLVYTEKDDLVVITTPDDAQATMEVRVYDCRDLLTMPTVRVWAPGGAMPGVPARGTGFTPPGEAGLLDPRGAYGATPAHDPFAPSGPRPGGGIPSGEGPGYFGFNVDETPQPGSGVIISGVTKGGPAEAASLYVGDIITAVDGNPCKDLAHFDRAVRGALAGAKFTFTVNRGAKDHNIAFTFGEDPYAAPRRQRSGVLPQAAPGGVAAPGVPGGAAGGTMGGMGGGLGGMQPHAQRPLSPEEEKADQLIEIITTAVNPDSWSDMGGPGTIGEYNGLVVVSQSARTHSKIEKVLNMLREAANLPTNGVPKVVR